MHNNSQTRFQAWIIVSTLLFCILFPVISFPANIKLSASVDKNQLTLEDSIELSIKIDGVRNPPIPELPALSDFRVRPAGTQSSTKIFNSDMRVTTTHKYLLIPKNEGTFVIGSAILKLSGTIYKSDPITVTVKKPEPEKSKRNESAFTETSISKTNPFLNEQVVYTFKLFRRVEARNLNLSMPYDEAFFRKEDVGKAKRYSQVINGIAYDVDELPVALFPIKVGKSIIPPSMMELDLVYRAQENHRRDPFARFFNDPFFGGTTKSDHKILTTKPIEIDTQPLPKKGKPKEFGNLVGRFAISATIGKTNFESGDTTTLTVTVSGTGNVMDAALANPNLDGRFKIYPDQPTFRQTLHGNRIGGEKVFKFALVPYSSGEQTIPSIPLSYFDPEKNKYTTVSTRVINLTVKPGTHDDKLNLVQSGVSPTRQNGSAVSILARDILPIHTQLEDFESIAFDNHQRMIYIIGILIPIVIYPFAAGYIRYAHQMNDDTSYSRRQGAYNKAKKKLDQLSASNSESKDFVREISQIIREYIGDKLNLQGTAFTSKEMEKKLNEYTFAQEKISAVRKLLKKCESMQYTPVMTNTDQSLIDESIDLLKKLEKQA